MVATLALKYKRFSVKTTSGGVTDWRLRKEVLVWYRYPGGPKSRDVTCNTRRWSGVKSSVALRKMVSSVSTGTETTELNAVGGRSTAAKIGRASCRERGE